MTDTRFFSPAARSAPNPSVRSTSPGTISVEITRAPERGERSSSAERSQSPRLNRTSRAQSSNRAERGDPQTEQAVVRGEVVAVSDEGEVQVRTPEGDFELQLTDLRVVRRLQAEIAQRSVEIEIIIPPAPDQAQVTRSAEILIVPVETDRAPPSQYRSASLDTPVQIQISDAVPPSVNGEAVLVPLQALVEGNLPAQPLRLEAVAFDDVAAFLSSSSVTLDVVAQVVDVQSGLQPVLVVDANASQVAIVRTEAVLNTSLPVTGEAAAVQIVPLVVVEGDDGLPVPIPVPESLVAPQLAASVVDVVAAVPQNGITVLPNAAIPQPLQDGAPVRLNGAQSFPQVVEGVHNVLAEPLILNNLQAISTQAVVVGKTPENLPVLSVPQPAAGGESLYFVLHYPVGEIVPGTEISFTPVSGVPGEAASNVLVGAQQSALPLPFGFLTPDIWPAMTSTLQSLQQAAPAIAQAMSAMTPSPSSPGQMTPAALFFMAAVGAGDLSNLLGSKHMESLRRTGQSGMIERLGADIKGLSRLVGEPVSQDWRVMMLPILWDNEIHKAVIHYKRDEGSSDDGDGSHGKQTRFVLDLNLDAMGAVQVDTLFKPGRLDTIVRTEQRFSEAMHAEMRRMYTDGLKLSEMGGELSFQNDAEQWVKILPKARDVGVRV